MSRTMLKLYKSENGFIVFQTIQRNSQDSFRYKGKSSNFYMKADLLEKAFNGEFIVDCDINNFAQVAYNADLKELSIKFTWLSGVGVNELKGGYEYLTVDGEAFKAWLDGGNGELRLLAEDSRKIIPSKLIFDEKANEVLRNVLAIKSLRNKLIKKLTEGFIANGGFDVNMYSDGDGYSFYFCKYKNGKFAYNGGLILHGKEDLEKAYYSIHT